MHCAGIVAQQVEGAAKGRRLHVKVLPKRLQLLRRATQALRLLPQSAAQAIRQGWFPNSIQALQDNHWMRSLWQLLQLRRRPAWLEEALHNRHNFFALLVPTKHICGPLHGCIQRHGFPHFRSRTWYQLEGCHWLARRIATQAGQSHHSRVRLWISWPSIHVINLNSQGLKHAQNISNPSAFGSSPEWMRGDVVFARVETVLRNGARSAE